MYKKVLYGFVLLSTWHGHSSHIHGHNVGVESPNMCTRSSAHALATTASCTQWDEDKVIVTSMSLFIVVIYLLLAIS